MDLLTRIEYPRISVIAMRCSEAIARHASDRRGLSLPALVLVLVGCSEDSSAGSGPSQASAGASGQVGVAATGGTVAAPAYERLECDLPTVISYCGGATCHNDDAEALGSSLALVSSTSQQMLADVESRLVDVPASYHNVLSPALCPSEPELLVDPAGVEQSLLLKKVLGTQTCGDEMPKFPYPEWGSTNNPGEQREAFVACIRAWVMLLIEDYNRAP